MMKQCLFKEQPSEILITAKPRIYQISLTGGDEDFGGAIGVASESVGMKSALFPTTPSRGAKCESRWLRSCGFGGDLVSRKILNIQDPLASVSRGFDALASSPRQEKTLDIDELTLPLLASGSRPEPRVSGQDIFNRGRE